MNVSIEGRDTAFLTAAQIGLELVQRPEVGERWTAPSALPKMSVGALACHLGRQVQHAQELLTRPTSLRPLCSVDEHYRRAAWVTSSSPDDPANDRGADDAEAELGPLALHRRTSDALKKVALLLSNGTAHDVVLIPWQGWALRRSDFLLTRLLETVVHTDDLAVSVELPTPEYPEEVFTPVRDLLVRLAVERHGQSAVISTLARRERARAISAF